MAHKSHRQKALQAQLAAPPEISLVKPKKVKVPKVAPPAEGMDVDDDVVIAAPASTSTPADTSTSASSSGFAPLSAAATSTVLKGEFRRVPIPPHRMTPLKREWVNLYTPLVEMLGLQVRMNVKRRAVEIKVGLVWLSSNPSELRTYGRQWSCSEGCRLCQGVCIGIRGQREYQLICSA